MDRRFAIVIDDRGQTVATLERSGSDYVGKTLQGQPVRAAYGEIATACKPLINCGKLRAVYLSEPIWRFAGAIIA